MVRQIWKLDTGEKRWLSPQECAGQLRLPQRAQEDTGTTPSGHAGQPPGWVVVQGFTKGLLHTWIPGVSYH